MKNKKIIILTLMFFVFISCGSVSNSVSAADITLAQALDDNLQWSSGAWHEWYAENNPEAYGKDWAGVSVTTSAGGNIGTSVVGPGTISFYWKKICNTYWGGYYSFIDEQNGKYIRQIDYNGPGIVKVHIGPGVHTLNWMAGPADSFFYGTGNAYLDNVQWTPDAYSVVSTSPKKFTKKASRTSNIYIKFNKNIKKSVNWSKIVVKKNGKKISIKTSISGNKISIKTNKRSKNTYYTVYIPKSAITDDIGNKFTKGYTFKFKTK